MKRKGCATAGDAIGGIVVTILLFGLMVANPIWQWHRGYWQAQEEAVEAGVAEWRIDSKTGEKSFHWLKGSKGDE